MVERAERHLARRQGRRRGGRGAIGGRQEGVEHRADEPGSLRVLAVDIEIGGRVRVQHIVDLGQAGGLQEVDPGHLHGRRAQGEHRQAAAGGVAPAVGQHVDAVAADQGRRLRIAEAADGMDGDVLGPAGLGVRRLRIEDDLDLIAVVGRQHRGDELAHLACGETGGDIADSQLAAGGGAVGERPGLAAGGVAGGPAPGLGDVAMRILEQQQRIEPELIDRRRGGRVGGGLERRYGFFDAALMLQGARLGQQAHPAGGLGRAGHAEQHRGDGDLQLIVEDRRDLGRIVAVPAAARQVDVHLARQGQAVQGARVIERAGGSLGVAAHQQGAGQPIAGFGVVGIGGQDQPQGRGRRRQIARDHRVPNGVERSRRGRRHANLRGLSPNDVEAG